MILIKELVNGNAFQFDEYDASGHLTPNFMGRNPTFGYQQEYIEKRMVSGRIRRIYKGKRFTARIPFGTLLPASDTMSHMTNVRANGLYYLLDCQRQTGYLWAEVTDPESKDVTFKGNVVLDVDGSQRRFVWDAQAQDYVWTGYNLIITAVELKE